MVGTLTFSKLHLVSALLVTLFLYFIDLHRVLKYCRTACLTSL